jgi:hypothetical protein
MTTTDGEYENVGDFDASWILPDTIMFGSVRMLDGSESGVPPWSGTNPLDLQDVEEPVPPENILDGDLDAYFIVDTEQSGLTPRDTRACVMGLYLDPDTGEELEFSGCDSIRFIE